MLATVVGLVTSALLYGLLGLVLAWCSYRWTHRLLLQQAEKLPSIFPRLPFIGSAHFAIGSLENITSFIIWMWTTASQKGYSTYCFWAGPVPFIITQDPEHIKKLLNSSTSLRKGEEAEDSLRNFSGEGLLYAEVERWKVTRRSLNQVFHPRNLEHMVSVFNENSRQLMTRLSDHEDGPPVDALQPLLDLGLHTVCHIIFGLDAKIDVKSAEFQDLKKVVERIPVLFTYRIIKVWLRFDFLFNFLYKKELNKLEGILRKFSEAPLKKAKEKYKSKKIKSELVGKDEVTERPSYKAEAEDGELITAVSVYSWMQENLSFITDKSLEHEMVNLYLTGTDTIGNGVASCLLALAQYQDIQERLHAEITSVVGPDDDVTSEHLKDFPYMEQVLKETLRFFTIVPFLSRRSSEEFKLGPCSVPPGTSMFLCLAGLHMNPTIYPEPCQFDPERFAPGRPVNVDGYTFIPFSGGPRNCIGKTYSFMLMKIALIHILRKYNVSTTMDIHKLKKNYAITMVNTEGYNIQFKKRS